MNDIDACSKLLISWFAREQKHLPDNNTEISNMFTSQVLIKRLHAMHFDIELPASLLLMLAVCSDGNPAYVQLIFKELLMSIRKTLNKPIPLDYTITSKDFVDCFVNTFPAVSIPEIKARYDNAWATQKSSSGYNACDTREYWAEAFE